MSPEELEERRAADQDAALEAAFVEGTLPEEDRRHEEPTLQPYDSGIAVSREEEPPLVEAVEPVPSVPLEEKVPPGTIIERTVRGWQVRLMYGGAPRLVGEGATIRDALTAVGLA